nr:hypothetical protein [Tanacetum cinerariifolium]
MTDVLMVDKEDEKKIEKAMGASDDQVKRRQAEIYKIDMDHASKVLSMQEDEPEVQEVVDVGTTAKLITKVIYAPSESVPAANTTIAAVEPQVLAVIIIVALVRVVAASTRKRKGVVIRDPEEESTTIRPTKTKSKDKGKGIIIEEPKLMKKKQQVKMNEEYARKLHAELNKDIDWYKDIDWNATIDHVKQRVKEDRLEDLESLWNIVKERFSTSKPNNLSDEFLLTTLGAMFKRPDGQAQLILLVKRRYPLSRFTLDQLLNAVRLGVEEQSEISLELL